MNTPILAGVIAFIFLAISGLASGWLPLLGEYKMVAENIRIMSVLNSIFVSGVLGCVAVLFLVSLWGCGNIIGLWAFRGNQRGCRMRGIAWGIMGASLLVLGLGLSGLLFRPVFVAMIFLLLGCVQRNQIHFPATAKWNNLVPALLLIPILPDVIIAPILPPVNVDMLVYHLGVPELWRMAHRIYAYPGNMTFSYPMGLERLVLPLQAFSAGGANTWFQILLLALSAIVFSRIIRELGSPHARAFGWLAFGSAASINMAMQGHQDIGVVFAVVLAMRAFSRGSNADMITACALMPFLKYTGLEYAATFFLAWFIWKTPRRGRLFAFPLLIGCIVPNLPWLVKNILETGNPLYPFFHNLLPSLNWRDWNTGLLWAIMRNATVEPAVSGPLGKVGGWLSYFWNAGGSLWFSWHTALFCLVPFVLLARGVTRVGRMLAFQALLFAILFLYPDPKVGRYILPESLVPLALCAMMINRVSKKAVWILVAIIVPLNAMAVAGQARSGSVTSDEVLIGSIKPEKWWRISMGSLAGTIESANRDLSGRGRVLIIGEPSGLGLNRPWLTTDDTNIPAWRLAVGDSREPDRMRIRLRQSDIKWIFYNPLRASRLASWTEPELADMAWMQAWKSAWKSGTTLIWQPKRFDWTGAVYTYEVHSGAHIKASSQLPWLPGAERFLVQTVLIGRGLAEPAELAAQYALMGEFGVSSYSRMLDAEYFRKDHARARSEFKMAQARGFHAPFLYMVMVDVAKSEGRACEALRWLEKSADMNEGEDLSISDIRKALKEECQEGRGK